MIHEFDLNQDYYTFALISLMKIVSCSEFLGTRFINHKCFDMKSGRGVPRS